MFHLKKYFDVYEYNFTSVKGIVTVSKAYEKNNGVPAAGVPTASAGT